jgi:SPW repeat
MARNWVYVCIGFWLIISPWILGFAEISIAKWSNVFIGLVVVIMSVWDIFGNHAAVAEKGRKEQSNVKK